MSTQCRTVDFVACDYLGTRGALFSPGAKHNHDFTEASNLVLDEFAQWVNFHPLSTPAECFGWSWVAFTQEVGPKSLADLRGDRVRCHRQLILNRLSIRRIKHLANHVDDYRGFHSRVVGDHVHMLVAFLRRQHLQGVISKRKYHGGIFAAAEPHHPRAIISLINPLQLANSVR